MMRIPGVLSMMVWASIFATVGIFIFGGYFAGMKAAEWQIADPKVYTDQEIMIATYGSYALYAVGGLLILLFLFMRKRIQMAMGCVKEASKAMLQMPLIIFFPVGASEYTGPARQTCFCSELILPSRLSPLPSVVQVLQGLGFTAFMFFWTVFAVNIASMGEYSTSTYAAGTVQVTVSICFNRSPTCSVTFTPTIFASSRYDRSNFQPLSKDVAGTCYFASSGLDNSFLR